MDTKTGSVKVGEVIRYTISYSPANDRILPAPHHLFLKIKNTSSLALRAAFIHGPYTLYVSSSPGSYRTDQKFENPRQDGVPEFEPNLKAGGSWTSQLSVPEEVRKTAGDAHHHDGGVQKSISWIVEVASQVIFSNSAAVHYEILLGRDENSLSLGFMGTPSGNGLPGQVSDHQQSQAAHDGHHSAQLKGVFSRAIKLKVEDTASLWDNPKLPEWEDDHNRTEKADAAVDGAMGGDTNGAKEKNKRQKKVHLVVLTHGLHSNLGADMLYMKESIDEATRQAKLDAHARRSRRSSTGIRDGDALPGQHHERDTDTDEDDEEVVVRGFSGNAVRTEKGIKYLGKRLAKYVLAMTYPDQPYKPITRSTTQTFAAAMVHDKDEKDEHGLPTHKRSSIRREPNKGRRLAYTITSISFIGHSLGGLIQTYAVAYIQKHSPQFFEIIKPINFVALATPFLGLSNENPLYVKFALDFGLVGRTGQDLGLTWRAPNLARSGWGAIVSGMGENAHKKAEADPRAKPLLRILPTGPAHTALKRFRNRTVYSNVVNDGIVPLRTSCLLFLDWQGLDRVEKARRENGLVGTVAGWGWAELTGANASTSRRPWIGDDEESMNTPTREGHGEEVPQPAADAAVDDDRHSVESVDGGRAPASTLDDTDDKVTHGSRTASPTNNTGALDSILGLFRSSNTPKSHSHTPKHNRIYKRSQTVRVNESKREASDQGPKATSGEGVSPDPDSLSAPPKTTFFESAGDLLNPPLPPVEFLIDPSRRPRTIFHDRVYHPQDIPPPPVKRKATFLSGRRQSTSSTVNSVSTLSSDDEASQVVDGSSMKVEEKIARAYHRDLSWRKVLVRLEPDAHNNMIVRRKFANAYGWPVVKHLVDTHFSDDVVARMRDDDEGPGERAKEANEAPDTDGDELKGSKQRQQDGSDDMHSTIYDDVSDSELRESADRVPPLNSLHPGSLARALNSTKSSGSDNKPHFLERQDSSRWSDGDFMDSEDDSDDEDLSLEKRTSGSGWNWTEAIAGKGATSPKGTKPHEMDAYLGHSSGSSRTRPAQLAKVRSGEADATVGLGHEGSLRLDGDRRVSEEVARLSINGLESPLRDPGT
ncbi:MAG: hypothetical protein M1818_002233 [Claussenomyces sp. TS43310]|nr:MAG: hypothetical protein M1818_002233 [Claussenomyces sp. TS43310]